MKKLSVIIVLALVAGFTSVQAQGPIQIVNSGTNLVVASQLDTTNTPVIASVYSGAFYTMNNAAGASNTFVLSGSLSYITNVNASGGISIVQRPSFAPSGYRVGVAIFNPNNYGLGIKFSGSYPTNAVPDRIIAAKSTKTLYFEDGYNGAISARTLSNQVDGGTITYSEIGN